MQGPGPVSSRSVQAAGRIIQRTWARRNGNIRLQYLRIFSLVPGCLVANISCQWRIFMYLFWLPRFTSFTPYPIPHLYQFSLFVDFSLFCHFLSFPHDGTCLKTEAPLSHATLDAQWGSGNKNIPVAIRSYRMRKISVGGYTCTIDFLPQFWLEKFPVYNANNIYYLIKHWKWWTIDKWKLDVR